MPPASSASPNPGSDRPLRVCYFGTYRANYARNRLMIERLRARGVEVIECHETLWHGDEDREQAARGGWLRPSFLWRAIRAYTALLWKFTHTASFDILMVGYPGQFDVILARMLGWMRRKPLVWDILMSIHLITLERKLEQRSGFTSALIQFVERFACRMPELLIIDTQVYARWYRETYQVQPERIRLLPLGADDRIFRPVSMVQSSNHPERFQCIYYGTFIPNHGVQYIAEAAQLLKKYPEIYFTLIGRGPQRQAVQALAQENGLDNVTFIDWLEREELIEKLSCAGVILGSFGAAPQSLMTVHNKVYEGMAMAKPVITGDSPAVREIFNHGEHILLCERENPQSLSEAILTLYRDPELRHRLAMNGHKRYQERFSMDKLGDELHKILLELVQPELV